MIRTASLALCAVACAGEPTISTDAAATHDAADARDGAPACDLLRARAIGIGWNHALAIGRDGALYVTNNSIYPGIGEVLRIEP